MISLRNDALAVEITPLGAELQSVRDGQGRDWLWSGDPAIWAGRSPLLFPVIGKHPGGQVLINGQRYPIRSHGVARTARFQKVAQGAISCTLRLTDDEEIRAAYPFPFILDMTYRLEGASLAVTARVANPGEVPMPFCFGYHPAFPWPLPDSAGRPHRIHLANGASPRHQRLDADGLRAPDLHASAFVDGVLTLDHGLFEADALIIPGGAGSQAWYGADGRPGIALAFADLPQLGIWTKPSGPFICIEPWHGLTSPADPDEPLDRREGAITLGPAEERSFTLTATFGVERPV
ncbi:MAG: aldose 1-epimerase family protein [Bosea sp. (in: a-proteobacteria)]|uniref:aldose 1-epimerase family protein n=1 Tax=Bosea sp. (in: a-proteobacteria) TaxID=1871050 RepID=UPI00273312CD|nr:aldose 1-epimerase family protein [Bosea sp. (in: a-proteobacteria)]MDP3258261.1 aldose 1-epimerase family protein [Bosea sp. (in: a-proteobacteria)]MDP3320712.1 aldose 1-epimerase family protein [Bosea sp. (in: a-proteobacteria)]